MTKFTHTHAHLFLIVLYIFLYIIGAKLLIVEAWMNLQLHRECRWSVTVHFHHLDVTAVTVNFQRVFVAQGIFLESST